MFSFDASSMIHAWDNYPPANSHFNSLWAWVAEQVKNKQFGISEKALDEVSHKIPKCKDWLVANSILIFPLTGAVLSRAKEIKILLDIDEDAYTKGVNENDLFIIATAKENNTTLVSEENQQTILPQVKSNYKIPAVCDIPEVNVKCVHFIDLLKQS